MIAQAWPLEPPPLTCSRLHRPTDFQPLFPLTDKESRGGWWVQAWVNLFTVPLATATPVHPYPPPLHTSIPTVLNCSALTSTCLLFISPPPHCAESSHHLLTPHLHPHPHPHLTHRPDARAGTKAGRRTTPTHTPCSLSLLSLSVQHVVMSLRMSHGCL